MATFKIKVTQTCERVYEIEASNPSEAMDIVEGGDIKYDPLANDNDISRTAVLVNLKKYKITFETKTPDTPCTNHWCLMEDEAEGLNPKEALKNYLKWLGAHKKKGNPGIYHATKTWYHINGSHSKHETLYRDFKLTEIFQ